MSNQIKSLGYRTDFIFNRYDGSVVDKGEYIVATANNNPNYFWGNLLLYKKPPKKSDFPKWKNDFKKEFPNPKIFHITLAWDSPNGCPGEIKNFEDDGFKLEKTVVLTAEKVHQPPKYNPKIQLKVISSNEVYERCVQIQIACGDVHLSKKSWEDFYKKQMEQYKLMINDNLGHWFAATLNGKIVGCLGIFTDGNVGRFQIMSTDPNYQRRGVCGSLVFHSANYAFEKMGVETLVMVADEEYHAAKIYESVGFVPTQKQVGLCWWDKEKYS